VGIVDERHAPLAPFDSWLDTRCGDVVRDLEPLADAVVASSGCAPTISIGPKMAWWQRNHPEVCEAAASFVTAAGYVAAVACGRSGRSAFIDPTHLHFASVADVANARWNTDLDGAFGLDLDLLPEIIESAEHVGLLTPGAAADFGLRAGTPVAADKVVPAISPIYGQNPGFQVFTYDVASGEPRDFATIGLANLPDLTTADADWREEYAFTTAYGLPAYSPRSVAALWNGLGQGGRIRDTYLGRYTVGHGTLAEGSLKAYACAIAFLERASYSACYCGE